VLLNPVHAANALTSPNGMKTEVCKLCSRVFWIFLPNVKIDPCNFELYCFKVGTFLEKV